MPLELAAEGGVVVILQFLGRLQAWIREIEGSIPQLNPDYPDCMRRPQVPNNAHE
ncbi:MAG: hypothetical protein ACOCXA_05435 [Planctomycetota bacterium]